MSKFVVVISQNVKTGNGYLSYGFGITHLGPVQRRSVIENRAE